MSDLDTKRMSLLVPQELYDKFLEFSQQEYKNTTTQITEFMVNYVKTRESAAELSKKQAILSTFSRCADLIYRLIQSKHIESNVESRLVAIAEFMLETSKDESIFASSDYISKIINLEKLIRS
jgi:hypothetical protein